MSLETMFAMGGALLLLGTLCVWSGFWQRGRGTGGRLVGVAVVPIPATSEREP